VELAGRAGEQRLGLRLDDALDTLARTGSPLIQGSALAVRVLLDLDKPAELGDRAAGWVDAAVGLESRRRLSRLLAGLLTAAGPLLHSAPDALDPLLDRIDASTIRASSTDCPRCAAASTHSARPRATGCCGPSASGSATGST